MMKTKFARSQLDSGVIDFSDIEIVGEVPSVSPGEILLEEFLKPLNMSARALAREMHVPANRITEIINGERSITADTALRLAHRFGGSAEFWMNLQVSYDLEIARRSWRPVAA
jgi:antitoxin HigA-1